MAELYMSRTCKWGTLRVVGGDVWNHEGDVLSLQRITDSLVVKVSTTWSTKKQEKS
jgi:hypothetical protein